MWVISDILEDLLGCRN